MDIRDEQVWQERRWRWDEHGYSQAFYGNITPMDVDALIERKGYFLAIETKEWKPADVSSPPPSIPRGQMRALEALAAQPKWTVLYIAGEAQTGTPWYIEHIGGTSIKDLRTVWEPDERRQRLTDVFQTWSHWVEARP